MNHHARSYSEQPQVAPMATIGNNQHQSFIRHHSDSQQSLDQLFNLSHQPSVPLRNRNLPQSFFNPGTKAATEATTNGTGATNGHSTTDVHMSSNGNNNLHMRSISFDQHQPVASHRLANQRTNLHMRTHSTIVPMPRLLSSHSSQEFLNGQPMQQDNSNPASTANNVSSPNHNNTSLQPQGYQQNQRHTNHHSQQHSNNQTHRHHHHHTLSNGWSSTGNSMDDLPTSPQWPATQLVSNTAASVQQQQVPIAQAPGLPEAAPMQQASHQQAFYSAHSIPAGETATNNPSTVHVHANPTNGVHSRSFSFNQRPPETQMINHGFHMRTHSTIAPMSSGPCNLHPAAAAAASHQSSHQSSQDFLNHSSATNASGSTAGWSSSGYSTDDMTANGHCWNGGGGGGGVPSQVPMAAGPHMTNTQGSTLLHHHHHPHLQPVVTHAQEQQPQQVFYQV